ncbi:lysophospholipid acyltransferase family protein [Cellulosilyticum sp. I15G10I2]|uniref:lysophospholipid acyltransferase family protein n=1 Tax=Cellulosilyticum sp. I15G10I2 TaxID=1892843 RepID=UPI00085C081C|nr:lysophospholipid acyltransferase family protein [Cellulosilyticum sp. I15G10I2]
MLGSIKVLNTMIINYITSMGERKKYRYGNLKYDKKVSRAHIYKIVQKLSQDMLKAGGITVEVKGKENLPQKGPVLYVANHKSIFDIVTLVSLIEDPLIFIGKKEVAKMPLVEKWFDALGCIYIDREDLRQSLKAIMMGISELKGGQSVVIFPEGTRAHGKALKEFKEGSFKLATKTKVPIIPIALQDTYKVFEEKKSVQKGKVYVNIGEAIYQEELEEETLKKLPQYIQGIVQDLLQSITFE